MTGHLSEAQFAEYALKAEETPEIPADVAAHLAACEACRTEMQAFGESVESFNLVSLAWSERQPAPSLRPLVRRDTPQPVWAIASWATAACLVVAGAVSFGTHRQQVASMAQSPAIAAVDDSPAQIERDNKLLMAVTEATSVRTASPLREYGLEASVPARAEAPHARDEND